MDSFCCSCLVFIPWGQGKLMSLATKQNSDIKYSCKHKHYENYKRFTLIFRGKTQFVQKVTFEPLMNLKKNKVGNIIYKSYYFQKLSLQKLEKHTITIFATVLFNFFMRQTSRWLLGVTQNMNCAFSLKFAFFNQGSLTFLM